ncbi:MAG: TolC family protein [Pseudomonadota bacterium]
MSWSPIKRSLVLALGTVMFWAALAGPALAGEAKGQLTLPQAIQKALAYSPNLAAAKEDLAAAEQQRLESETYFLPALSTAYTWQRVQNPTQSRTALGVTSLGSANVYQWNASLSQPLFTGFNLTSSYRLADLGVDVAGMQVMLAALDVTLAVKESFFDYLRAQKAEEVAQQAVTQLTSHLKNAQDFHEVGIIPINDVLKVEVELANAQQQEVTANNATSVAMSRLNTLLGTPVDGTLDVEDILSFHKVDIDYNQAHATARQQRPELKSLDLRLMQADQSVIQAQSRYYPQLNLTGGYVSTSDTADLGDSYYYDPSGWQVVTSLNWTFWEWGRTNHQVGQRRAQKRRLENVRRDVQDQVDLQVKQYYLALHDAEKNIATAKASIRSAKENYRITQERFKEQLTTNTEVLDAQTLLTQAQNNYYTALTVYNVAEARLRRAMGGGLPAGVQMPSEAQPGDPRERDLFARWLSVARPASPAPEQGR